MAPASPVVLLHRPRGEAAVAVGGAGRPEQAESALLQTADGGVLVKAIRREPDGSFIGEVYGVTPRQRGVARGDLVSFSESQIFTFRAGDESANPADAEQAEMVRAFEASFKDAPAPNAEGSANAAGWDVDISFPPEVESAEPVLETHQAARIEPERVEPERVEPERVEPERVEPERVEPERVVPKRVEPTPVDGAPVAEGEHRATCIECGAALSFTPVTDQSASAPAQQKVTCRRCGRINQVYP
jgi:hypothetical protein